MTKYEELVMILKGNHQDQIRNHFGKLGYDTVELNLRQGYVAIRQRGTIEVRVVKIPSVLREVSDD